MKLLIVFKQSKPLRSSVEECSRLSTGKENCYKFTTLLTRDMVFLSRRQSLLSNDSVISGMVVMRFSGMDDFRRVLSSEETRRTLWWGLTSPFSSLVLTWLGEGAVVTAWSLFNFMASNCDCRPHRSGKYERKQIINKYKSTTIQS